MTTYKFYLLFTFVFLQTATAQKNFENELIYQSWIVVNAVSAFDDEQFRNPNVGKNLLTKKEDVKKFKTDTDVFKIGEYNYKILSHEEVEKLTDDGFLERDLYEVERTLTKEGFNIKNKNIVAVRIDYIEKVHDYDSLGKITYTTDIDVHLFLLFELKNDNINFIDNTNDIFFTRN